MKLVVDDKIPHIHAFFDSCDVITALPGDAITARDLRDADVLIVRTITPVSENLLANTSVKFVGTASTGVDHIDINYLKKHHIAFASAAGANAQAVADYVAACINALQQQKKLQKNATIGVIGCGRIGRLVATHCERLGFQVICYDPLLVNKLSFRFVSFDTLITQSDLMTLHVPLTTTGLYPTFHMINEKIMRAMKQNVILMNTSRGSVIDQTALLHAKTGTFCLDVWENEPAISLEVLNKALIATPHIAGYSADAKFRATDMLYQQAADFFGWKKARVDTSCVSRHKSIQYDPLAHTQAFKAAFQGVNDVATIQKIFMEQRKNYTLR
ncbi:MAG TPA: 4-phosphoerythronate dehydrogenase [Coxiellaceae bacterium]|nr:4-phosphoerythronate dehydrogenase [Coxiellaceae bacterium]